MADLLKKIYNDPLDADIQIHLRNGTIIHAHSVVLKNRSPVIRAMLSDIWATSDGHLRFTHSDAAVAYVLRAIYMVNAEPPENIHKVIKFAHYLQLDAVLEQMCKYICTNTCGELSRNRAIKIAQLLEHHNADACNECVRRTLSIGRAKTGVDIIYDVARTIRPDTYAWFMDRLITTPHAPHYPIILSILYGVCHGLHDLITDAINRINVDDRHIKLHMINAVAHECFPEKHLPIIAAVFARHSQLIDTCGCSDRDLVHTCPDCAYKYCSACDMRFGCIAHGNNQFYCPRCAFKVTRGDETICLKCAERELRTSPRNAVYCMSHRVLTLQPNNHGICDVLTDPDAAWHEFLKIHSVYLSDRRKRRLDYVIWRVSYGLSID